MSTRPRRARGRPPRTPLSTNRTNFLRKPKAYQNRDQSNSGSASPVSHLHSIGRQERTRGRAAAHKGRHFVNQLAAEDDELSSLPEFEDRSSDVTDLDNTDSLFPEEASDDDGSYVDEPSEQESSDNESLSTVSSSLSKRKLLLKRPKTPEIPEDKDVPDLELPTSAADLLLPAEHVLDAVGVYEVLRHFWTILRLSPFTFEDFCACLLSEEQSNMFVEIHLTLLKAIFREEESSNTAFGPQDLKDSINISLFFMDPITWPEVLRSYLDGEKHPEFRAHLSIMESPNFPFVPYTDKLKVLQTLTDLFLGTTKVREDILNEGNIHYDDHCRACHKLGDLLCCETCSAVYHLTCVEPPMQEVPEDDWHCSVCRAHQIKGVTDCISEAERSGLLSRQEPLGFDRHARKYWFLCRRIIVEGEKESWYYSSKYQLEELLESLDHQWDGDLIMMLNEMKDDIIKQMAFTEDLTLSAKGNRKSMLEIENAQLVKVQVERSLKRKQEEEEKAVREEEERKKKEEEEEKKRKEEEENENSTKEDDPDTEEGEKSATEEKQEDSEVLETEVITSETEEITNVVSSSIEETDSTTTETVKTCTTTTTVTTVRSTTSSMSTPLPVSEKFDEKEEDEPPAKKAKMDSAGDNTGTENDIDELSGTGNKTVVVSDKSSLAEAIKSTGNDGKPKVINLQSLLPTARQTILNAVEKGKEGDGTPGKTVLLVNREGGKVTLQVQRQGEDSASMTTSTSTTSSVESRKMVTRSKTGSLTPKLFTDSVTLTTTSVKSSGKSSVETSINSDGDATVSKRKVSVASTITQQSIYFKLGLEGKFKQYQNQFTTNPLALNKHQHNEERDKRRHLSHKFSLTQNSEFKWNGNVLGNRLTTLATLRLTITQLESGLQAPFLHINWPNHRQKWQKAVQMCQTPRDFALSLAVLESCIKPCVMNSVWFESLGHHRLRRITAADREEYKKKEKEQKKMKGDDDDVRQVIWIKYTLGLKHQVWKQKGEEYRVTGGNGWQWISSTRDFDNFTPQDSVGLRRIAQKFKSEKVKEAYDKKLEKEEEETEESGVKEEKQDTVKPASEQEGEEECKENRPESSGSAEVSSSDVEMQDEGKESDPVAKTPPEEPSQEVKEEAMDVDESVPQEIDSEKQMNTNGNGNNVNNSLLPQVKVEKLDMKELKSSVSSSGVSRISTPRKDKVQISYEDYLNFMRKKYIEDKDTSFALELQKKLPAKADTDLINISEALIKKTYYPKVNKAPSIFLDTLLEKRMKQDEFERKQRLNIETQIALKERLTEAIETVQRKKDALEEKEKAKSLPNGETSDKTLFKSAPYSCYSPLCRAGGGSSHKQCYSLSCRRGVKTSKGHEKMSSSAQKSSSDAAVQDVEKKETDNNHKDGEARLDSVKGEAVVGNGQDKVDPIKEKKESNNDEAHPDNEEAEGNKENALKGDDDSDSKDKGNGSEDGSLKGDDAENEQQGGKEKSGKEKTPEDDEVEETNMETETPADMSTEDEEVDIEGEAPKDTLTASSSSDSLKSESDSDTKALESNKVVKNKESEEGKPSKSASVSDIVRNLVIKTMAEKAVAGGDKSSVLNAQALANAVANMSMEDLKAKLPPKRNTSDKFKLAKFTKLGTSKKLSLVAKTGRLPAVHKFDVGSNKKRSILMLERHELRKMARLGSRRESVMFNYNCKANHGSWPYPCPRPVFRTAWRYRTMNLKSLSAAALQLRILWACIKWDDMSAKPPAGGTNTISTETEITTTELLKRREVGSDILRSEFLVRKIVVPLGVPEKPKEKYTPQRSGLRVRKKVEPSRQTEPSVVEVWVPEESLELWEIKQFGEKLEKQRLAQKEKAAAAEKAVAAAVTTTTASTGVSVGTSAQGPQTTALMKAHMEQQLKQQRLALAQRRIAENQGIKISAPGGGSISTLSTATAGSGSNTTTIIINTTQPGRGGATYKTLTVSSASPSSLLAPGVIKTMQPKTVITAPSSLLGSQLRPGMRLQLPGSTVQQLRSGSITLAPKPGTTAVTPSTTASTITRLISPARPATPVITATPTVGLSGGKTHTIQIRPQTPGQPVQNLHLTTTPQGQLQVRGLLPGQMIQRLPDGKLQIVSVSTSQHQPSTTNTAAVTTTSLASPAQSAPATPRPTITIRPQQPQQILVTPPAASSANSSVPNLPATSRLVLPAGLPASAIRQVLSGAGGASQQLIIKRPGGGTQVISAQNLASLLGGTSQPGAVSAAASVTPAVTGSSVSAAPNLSSAIVISAPGPTSVTNVISSAGTQSSSAASTATAVIVNPPTVLSSTSVATSLLSTPQSANQTIISTLKPGATLLTPSTSATISTPSAGTSLLAGQVISASSLLQRSAQGTSLLSLGGTKLLASPTAGSGQILTRTLATPGSSPQLVLRPAGAATLATVGGQPTKVISLATPTSLTSPTNLQLKAVPGSSASQVLVQQPAKPSLAATSILPQILTTQASATGASSVLSSPEAGLGSPPPASASSPGTASVQPKYAITPAVVEQVVRQALLQNQAPEIQQKLLAMQKQIQQQSQTTGAASVSLPGAITSLGSAAAVLGGGSSSSGSQARRSGGSATPTAARSQTGQAQPSDPNRGAKSKAMTAEQKEEATRNSICSQVMKYMLDKIEREERQEQRNKKKLESAEEKQKRLAVINQQKALYKHKEALKKEILRKRSLMEKNLQQEIYNEMLDKLKKGKSPNQVMPQAGTTPVAGTTSKSPVAAAPISSHTSSTSPAAGQTASAASKAAAGRKTAAVETPRSVQDAKANRKRKQKIISTGVKGSLNPKERLYCVCKKPYDDKKFYIGCDLCSNWFHGSCVGISEERAKHIDSYICEDCRKQQENTSEELYCLCRTPYDENQFYIGCDRCQDWFHGRCVGISESEADDYDVYLCPNCQKQEVADPIAQKPLTQPEYQQLAKLLKDMQSHKMAWPFLHPVDPSEVPDYYDIVSEPMDLTIVEAKLKARVYTTLNDFVKDVTKIFDNCRLYNPTDTPYFQCAEVVETYFAQRIKALRSAHKL